MSYCPGILTVLSKQAGTPRGPSQLRREFSFRFVFTAASGGQGSLRLSAQLTQMCPDAQLSHFIRLSLGFLK